MDSSRPNRRLGEETEREKGRRENAKTRRPIERGSARFEAIRYPRAIAF